MAGFKLSCDYCGEKSPIKSAEQFKDMLKPKSDAKFTLSKTGLRCRKCGNKVEGTKVVKPNESK
jgi:hypothetical protein